ncbi:MAG TPA: S4 domain-containing protein, partial [Patescibacteria group bacterium]|nr:S4 domain-containing protein [Patescibacteria group bacterium]
MKKKLTFRVKEYWERIDHYLTAVLQSLSRSRIEKLIQNRQVTLNGAVLLKKSQEIFPGDRIVVEIVSQEQSVYAPSRPLQKLFED